VGCSVCESIPDLISVDTLHHSDDFPGAVAGLAVVSGETWEGQLRRCPGCGAHFVYTYDHDSQSGVGYGYTDETIERLFWFEVRTDGTLTLKNASQRVTGAMLGALIRDARATGRPGLDTITALEIDAPWFGDAPSELGDLPTLDCVWFKNGLTGLPASIGRLTRLENLWIAGNPIRELPVEIAALPKLKRVELQNTGIVAVPDTLQGSPIEFAYYRANVVPPPWRHFYTCNSTYEPTLKWLADHGAAVVLFDSGAWSHEDRCSLSLQLRAELAPVFRAALAGSPFTILADGPSRIELGAEGYSGADRIVAELVAAIP
jgi:hypothetical protein